MRRLERLCRLFEIYALDAAPHLEGPARRKRPGRTKRGGIVQVHHFDDRVILPAMFFLRTYYADLIVLHECLRQQIVASKESEQRNKQQRSERRESHPCGAASPDRRQKKTDRNKYFMQPDCRLDVQKGQA
jgi:hypothetical protein